MKIEKINDNQIRCTLTQADLEDRQIHLSELAYGTEKAKTLFRDMMQQANFEFGFEADNIPLMIEAIPVTPDSIILIITKVEDPEELDTRFSKFAPFMESSDADENPVEFEGADDILDIFQKIYEAKSKALAKKKNAKTDAKAVPEIPINLVREYQFPNIDLVIEASHGLNQFYQGENSLYQDQRTGNYILIIHQSGHSPEDFNKICNILSEYGRGKSFSAGGEAYLLEHGKCVLPRKALQKLFDL
jgi:adapter protein MecA 1/2